MDLANEIEENKLKLSTTHAPGYNRNMQSIKACSAYNFMYKPIQNVTRRDIERFLQAERDKPILLFQKNIALLKMHLNLHIKNI